MKVTVLHMERNEITGNTEGFTPVAEVNFPDGHNITDVLEYAFRWTNNVMGSWSKKIGEDANDDVTVLVEREDGLGLRSTSMFDRMEIGGRSGMEYFKEDVDADYIESPYDIRDVWAENFSTNSAQKVWAAKFAARHPNLAVLDLSSFKCGHDAPTYAIIDKILGASRTPHLTLHDIDANKPGGSIKIRVKTFAYTLEQYQRRLTEVKHHYRTDMPDHTSNKHTDQLEEISV